MGCANLKGRKGGGRAGHMPPWTGKDEDVGNKIGVVKAGLRKMNWD